MALVKYNNNSISDVTSTGLATGSLVPIKTLTASSSATLSFVHGTDGVVLDSTYPIYKFEFINCHPATDGVYFQFQGSTDGGSTYATTITSTFFRARLEEADANANLGYRTADDLAQSTSFQRLTAPVGNDNDQTCSGSLTLYNPSDTTFVKHFIARLNAYQNTDATNDQHIAGYFNTTSAVDAIQFKMSSGNIDSGKIKLYGIKDS
jgi:hypothetical protein